MKIRINHTEDETISDYGFEFDHWERTGVRAYIDNIGNALSINRDDVIVRIYSYAEGCAVDELEVSPQPYWDRLWGDMEDSEDDEQEERERYESIKAAWERMLASVPPPESRSDELRSAIREASELLRWHVVHLEFKDDDPDGLGQAQDAVDRIKELAPDAKVSDLLIVIVRAGD